MNRAPSTLRLAKLQIYLRYKQHIAKTAIHLENCPHVLGCDDKCAAINDTIRLNEPATMANSCRQQIWSELNGLKPFVGLLSQLSILTILLSFSLIFWYECEK